MLVITIRLLADHGSMTFRLQGAGGQDSSTFLFKATICELPSILRRGHTQVDIGFDINVILRPVLLLLH